MPDPTPAAAKKRGPKTPEGKARSSMNALRHGLRAKRFLLLPEEDSEEFSAFAADIRAAYRPTDAVEAGHVEAILVAMWREIRADRIEGEVMVRNKPGPPGQSHGTDLYRHDERASLTTALRYRTQAQMELRRATDLFWRHRKARLAGLLEEGEEAEVGVAPAETPAPCTNEFANENAPPAAAARARTRRGRFCTNEFPAPAPPPPEEPRDDTVTLLSTYRTLKKQSATDAWAWLNELTAEEIRQIQTAVASELAWQRGKGGADGRPGA